MESFTTGHYNITIKYPIEMQPFKSKRENSEYEIYRKEEHLEIDICNPTQKDEITFYVRVFRINV